MTLGQFCIQFDLSAASLTKDDIKRPFYLGEISQKQADDLLAELNEIDGRWRTSIPGLECASHLW